MKVKNITPSLGIKIQNVPPLNYAQPAVFSFLKRLVNQFGVVFFKVNALSASEFLKFACEFGEPEENLFFPPHEESSLISVINKEPHTKGLLGSRWHSDHTYQEKPASISILYCVECPKSAGRTEFIETFTQVELIKSELRDQINGLYAIHRNDHVFGPQGRSGSSPQFKTRLRNRDRATHIARHPVIAKHPDTGVGTIFVNPNFTTEIEGVSKEKSNEILQSLFSSVKTKGERVHIEWVPEMIALWDNRLVWHKAHDDFILNRREMWRVALQGRTLSALV